jgi:hypothetical protein
LKQRRNCICESGIEDGAVGDWAGAVDRKEFALLACAIRFPGIDLKQAYAERSLTRKCAVEEFQEGEAAG